MGNEDLSPFLSPKVLNIFRLFKQAGSIDAVRAAHPEITDDDEEEVPDELLRAMEMMGAASKTKAKRSGRKVKDPGGAYQLKITLRGSKPPIWRRVVVPSAIKLDSLHYVMQHAMGWGDCHLHLFDIQGRIFQTPDPDPHFRSFSESEEEADFRLCDLVTREKTKFKYEYDFGDGWEHTVLVEKILPAEKTPKKIVCLAGKGCCPPEDSGGIWGYYTKLEAIADPEHPEHQDIVEWMDEFDPDEFDLAEVNKSLGRISV